MDGGSPSSDGGWSVPDAGGGEVHGSRVLHYRTDLADFTQPIASELQAFALEEGGLRPLTVVTAPEGTFRIPDAPAGQYYLRLGTFHLLTDSRFVNLDLYSLGRQDAERATSRSAAVTVTASNLPLQPLDTYPRWEAVSSNLGTSASVDTDEPVPAGQASVSGLPATYNSYYPEIPRLLDASRGDYLYFTHLIERDNGTSSYMAVDRFFTQGVSLRPDETTALEGVFQEARPRTLTLEWWRSRFEAYKLQVHPRVTTSEQDITISPTAWSADAWYGYSGDLMYSYSGAGLTDVVTSFTYGNPYPFSWGEVIILSHFSRIDVRLPGTSSGWLRQGLKDTRRVADVAKGGPFAPRISPAQDVTVDGIDAQREHTLGSLTPRLRWKAPLLGTPSAYRVRITHLSANGNSTRTSHVAYLSTKETSIDVFPGILQPGQKYVFMVSAYLTPGVDLSTHPYANQVLTDVASADAVSSILSTPASVGPERASLPLVTEPSSTESLEFKAPRHFARGP
ncbi:hypothetical protein [Cystobacter fuscus]|uniref:hypothetical protein n=1 Tax=Cystobacter fuscus TaxID=43 RepID=UPI002B2BCBF0|nr:hypothetical protein F0U63_21255 [Cystobacter fuscus]